MNKSTPLLTIHKKYLSHDLRHVLAQVCSLNHLIRQELVACASEKLRMYNELIEEVAQQGLTMTAELLSERPLVDKDDRPHEIPSFSAFLRGFEDLYRLEATHRRIQFTVDMLSQDHPIEIGYVDLKRIIDNLITNAFKFTPPGGTVCVRSSLVNRTLTLQVQDSGIGMSRAMRQSVYTNGEERSGNTGLRGEVSCGLGLSVVRQLIRKYEGMLCCYPANPGTVFSVELPITLGCPI